jgi:hypothetical protein
MSFQSDIDKFVSKTVSRFDAVVRKVTLDLTSDLVRATPVDTGAARSNWFFGFERNLSVDTENISRNGRPSLERAAQFTASLTAGGTFWITNNLPYIIPLEFGHSKQAPQGMARNTVANWQGRVDKIVRAF